MYRKVTAASSEYIMTADNMLGVKRRKLAREPTVFEQVA